MLAGGRGGAEDENEAENEAEDGARGPRIGLVCLLVTSVVWAFSFGLIKTRLSGLDSSFVGAARLLLSALLFAPWIGREVVADRRLAAHLLVIGAVQYGAMYSLYLAAYGHLAAHQVALFTVLTPLYVVLWGDLRRRRLDLGALALAGIAAAGAALLYERGLDDGATWLGFFLVQAANLCFAAGQIEYRRLRRARPGLRDHRAHGLAILGGLGVSALVTTLRGGWASAAAVDTSALLALLYLGLVASGLGFFAWNYGAARARPASLAVLNNLKVPLGVAAALLFFDETAELWRLGVGGGAMVVAAGLAESRWARRGG